MRSLPSVILLVTLLCGCSTQSQQYSPESHPAQANATKWELLWSDEFETPGQPDPSRWGYDIADKGWRNDELQAYTDRRENARVENGNLVIEARLENYLTAHYTSARVVSRQHAHLKYGKVEIRAQLPSGRGTWPALWLLPVKQVYSNRYWPDNGEIDVMEHVGFDPGIIHGTLHSQLYNWMVGTQKTATISVPTASSEFHVYTLEWFPDLIEMSVDSQKFFSFSKGDNDWHGWPFDQEFYLIFNLAIGGNWGGKYGVDDSIFPQQLKIDYVRVYRAPN